MRNALAAEWIKIRSTRTLWALLAGAVAVVALSTLSTASNVQAAGLGRPLSEQDFFFLVATNLSLFAVVVGVRSFTDEFRHGTVVYSLLSTSSRTRLVLAKAVVAAAGAAVLAAIAQAVMLLILAVLAAGAGTELTLDRSDAAALAGLALACAGWAVIGVGVGAVVRHQVAAVVGAVLWVLVVENLGASFLGGAGRFLPGQAALAVAQAAVSPDMLPVSAAAALLTGYVAAALALAGTQLHRADV